MKLELNLDAVKNFNAKANALLIALTPYPNPPRRNTKTPVEPDIHISATFSEENIIGDVQIHRFVTDHEDNEVGKFFENNNEFIGLFDEGYKNLVRLAEGMQRVKELRDSVSVKLLTDLIFTWIQGQSTKNITVPMTEYVLSECEKQIREMELWLPIAWLQIASNINLGRVTFKTITKRMMDNCQSRVPTPDNPEKEIVVKYYFQQERHQLQGYAAATIQLYAEPQRASEIAFEEAENAVNLLRFYSPANFSPRKISYCTLLGREKFESKKYLIVKDGEIDSTIESALDWSEPSWQLNSKRISYIREEGLDLLNDLLRQDERTAFQNDVLNALLLYSKSSLAKNYANKLIYILVALESLLLKDSSEPIGNSLRERMAVLINPTIDGRLAIIKNVSNTYGLRSSFIHHGKNIGIDAVETLQTFMCNAWACLHEILTKNIDQFSTKAEFLEAVERLKLSGGTIE